MRPEYENLRGRATRFAFAVAVHILAFLVAFYLSPPIMLKKPEPELLVMTLPSSNVEKPKPKPAPRSRAAHKAAELPKAAASPVTAEASPLNMIMVSSDVFRAGDISRIHSAAPTAGNADTQDAQADSGSGEGPGGAKLYNAEWYREPTDAEMAYYLPKGAGHFGWGLIICRTMADYRVEDCRELGEAPPGVGLARSMRQAAWQFRVRPPRIDGKPMIGAWVRIRFDMIQGFKK